MDWMAEPSLALTILDEAARLGLDHRALARSANLDREMLTDQSGILTRGQILSLWRNFEHEVGVTEASLLILKAASVATYGIQGYLAITSSSVRQAIENANRYCRLTSGRLGSRLIYDRDGIAIASPGHPLVPRSYSEFCICSYAVLSKRWSVSDAAPRRVGFAHARPPNSARYSDLLLCPVVFDQPINYVVWDNSVVEEPMRSSRTEVAAYFESLARERHRQAAGPQFVRDLRSALRSALREGDPRLSEVARMLGMSTRTLQRHLRDHELRFQQLLDDARLRTAMTWLQGGDVPIDQIGERLGYADPKSFRRAFRRWTGCSPSEVRRSAFRERADILGDSLVPSPATHGISESEKAPVPRPISQSFGGGSILS